MIVEVLHTLTEELKAEILLLHEACMAPENLKGETFLSNELNYDRTIPTFFLGRENGSCVAFLTLFLPTHEEAEVTAFTLPSARERGCFATLLLEAVRVCTAYGIPSLLFAVEGTAVAGHAVLSKMPDARLQHTEYRMRLSGVPEPNRRINVCAARVTAENIALYRKMLAEAFDEKENEESSVQTVLTNPARSGFLAIRDGNPIGACHISTEDGMAFIYGLALTPAMRGKGLGEAFMREVVHVAIETGLPVMLDVDSDNVAALQLYRKLGFIETFSTEYHAQPLHGGIG